jgi:hypothetical protein
MPATPQLIPTTKRRFVIALTHLLQVIPCLRALPLRRGMAQAIFFDRKFYRATNRGAIAKLSPLLHFFVIGAFDGRRPHPLFDPAFYLERYPDVREAGVNPLLHFVRYGAAEGRKPHPMFQPDYYLKRCAEAEKSGETPLAHFLQSRAEDCVGPHVLFDCEHYRRYRGGFSAEGVNPLVRYLSTECDRGAAAEGTCQFGQRC